jgi:type VI secretion system protein ImpH
MVSTSGAADTRLNSQNIEKELRDHPYAFRFFQAVYLLQRILSDREHVGQFARPETEAVRFEVNNSLAFPASEIQEIVWNGDEAPRVRVNFMGLTGPSGLLPRAYTELLMERARSKDRSLEAFLDIFHHRMLSLFYAAWEKYRFLFRYEGSGELEGFSRFLGAFCGMATDGLLVQEPIKHDSLFYYAGILSMHSRSATALREMIAEYFDVPVEIQEFVGAWYRLDENNQCSFEGNGSYSERLGIGIIVGDEIWSQQSRVRIRLGPLSRQQYRQFLPSGSAYTALSALTKFFSGHEIDFEVQLIMNREDVPSCVLGGDETPVSLGWGAWIKSTPHFDRDPDETIFLLN